MSTAFSKDLYRYYGEKGETFAQRLLRPVELYIGHSGMVVINPDAEFGKNMNIAAGVTIGRENRGKRMGAPKFAGDCWIGANAVVVGNVHIGEDVLIAPLAYVNFDVPSHSIVIGNPARIIEKENATEAYICNRV